VYEAQRKSTARPLTRVGLEQVLHEYMVHWLLGDDTESIQSFLEDKYRLDQAFPRWSDITGLQVGEIRAFDFERSRAGTGMSLAGYSFGDAQEIVGRITSSFASFWDDECTDMRDKLIAMDEHHTGRVPLSRFYSRRLSAEWRFAESEDYLRELGALDETSTWHGKEVIIPNYIGAASNCIVATPHYLVCCTDTCESILGDLEASINAAVASPDEILALVKNMSSQTSLDDEDPPKLKGSLSRQLDQIATAHGGKVPLHGRLFAQWLHYAFPRECPFPHKSGATAQKAPGEFGDYVVSENDRRKHADVQLSMPVEVQKEDMQWMSQWSSEEELQSEYAMDLRAPWEVRPLAGAVVVLLLVAAGVTGAFGWSANSKGSGSLLPQRHGKAHFI